MWFRRKSKSDGAEVVRGLRQQALTVDAADLGLGPTADRTHVWGVVMETGYPEAVATLVVFGDGTTSLYFSNGGGMVGAGEHDVVRAASKLLLSSAEAHLNGFAVVAETPLPEVGRVRERQNWIVRTSMRRYTRLSNGLQPEDREPHARRGDQLFRLQPSSSFTAGLRVSPATAAGVTNPLFDVSNLVALLVESESKKAA